MLEILTNLFKKPQPEVFKGPSIAKPRFPCPFYGFHGTFHPLFMDQSGNQCPLIGHTCQMEYCPSGPDWTKCPLNCEENKETIKDILDLFQIIPGEFWPKGQSSWKGMPFKVWMDYVMDPATPRPVASKKSETPAEAGNN